LEFKRKARKEIREVRKEKPVQMNRFFVFSPDSSDILFAF